MSRQRLIASLVCALGLAACWSSPRAAAQGLPPPPPPPQPYVNNPVPTLGAPTQQPIANNFSQQPTARPTVSLQPPPPGPVYPPPPPPGPVAPNFGYPPPPPPPNSPFTPTPLIESFDRPVTPPPGFFGAIEAGIIAPHVKTSLVSTVNTLSGPRDIGLPVASQGWVGSPRFTLGYQLGDNMGQFLVTYRSIVSEGSSTIYPFDFYGGGYLRSRLNMNVIDLDYASGPQQFARFWSVDWLVGARIGTAFFDSVATGDAIQRKVSNNFVGGGPHAAVNLERALPGLAGVSLFGRLDGAVLIGGIDQTFEQTYRVANGGPPVFGAATHVSETQAVPVLTFRTGFNYTPPVRGNWMRFGVGYECEYWWNVGNAGPSRADISTQGFFLRGEFSF